MAVTLVCEKLKGDVACVVQDMKLGCSQDGPGNTAVLDEVFAGEPGFAIGIRDLNNADNRNVDYMRDISPAGSVQQAARAFNLDLPGPIAGGMAPTSMPWTASSRPAPVARSACFHSAPGQSTPGLDRRLILRTR